MPFKLLDLGNKTFI